MSHYIIDEIHPTAWRLRIRDEATGKTEEVALRPGEPWKVRVGGTHATKPADKVPAAKPAEKPAAAKPSKGDTSKARTQEAPADTRAPKNEGIKLALENGSGNSVIATAHGKGATSWAKAQGKLLGRKWDETEGGNPFVMLKNSPTLVQDLEKALPGVRLDTKHYTAPDAPRPAPADEKPSKPADAEPDKKPRKAEDSEAKAADPPRARKAGKTKQKTPGRPKTLHPGAGPGGLEWTEIDDAGNRGIVAPWQQGLFKILRAGTGVYALFYEYERGGYEQLACGKPDALKQVASERVQGSGPRVTEALARGACKTCEPAPPATAAAANEPPKRPRKIEAAEPPAPPPEPMPTPEPTPSPAPAPPSTETNDASHDRELMAGFRQELADIFDEEDD